MRFHWTAITALNLTLMCVLAAGADARASAPLPRYHLLVGQELTYRNLGFFKYQGGSFTSASTDIYDVVRKNPDGSWHVIGRLSSNFGPSEPQLRLIAFDIHPNGDASLSPGASSLQYPALPVDFPALPADVRQMQSRWGRSKSYDGRIAYTALPATRPGIASFQSDTEDPIDKIYLMTHRANFVFDVARGIVLSISGVDTQGYGFIGKGADETVLTGNTDKPKNWLEEFSRDADIYFAAYTRYSQVCLRVEQGDAPCDSTMTAALHDLQEARKNIATPEITDLLDKLIAAEPSDQQYFKQVALDRQAVIGKPAPAWKLTDLSGNEHSLEDYRGKVVILDFWYRGCGWCMRAMPQVQQLASDFAVQNVAVLGMNTDSDPIDPKFVVNAYGLTYPILHVDQNLVQQYHVEGFPTLFLIGPDGIVSDIHVGYSPTLRVDLARKISALLAGQ